MYEKLWTFIMRLLVIEDVFMVCIFDIGSTKFYKGLSYHVYILLLYCDSTFFLYCGVVNCDIVVFCLLINVTK